MKLIVACLRFINLFFKPLKLQDKVAIISRQSNVPTLDIKMLTEELDKRNVKTLVLTSKMEKSLSGMAKFAMHLLKQIKAIATCKVVIVDGYCIPASVLAKKKGQTIVQMWHALGAIKKFGWQNTENPDGHSREVSQVMCMHRNYDYILAPSEVTGKFFAEAFRTPENKIFYCGLPRIDFLKTEDKEKFMEICREYPAVKEKPIVLYVPTFRKGSEVSMGALTEAFEYDRFNLVIKKHFLDKGDYKEAKAKGAIVDDKFSSMDWLRIAKKVVTDYSAIAFEAAVIEKELYIYQPDFHQYENNVGLNVSLEDEAIGKYVAKDQRSLVELLKEPYDIKAVKEFCGKFISVNTDNCTGQLCDFIMEHL